jgi:hypothetical protein
MRKLVLITAMVLASASAQAGESRSLSTYPVNDTTSAAPSQPVAGKSLRADNDTPAAPAAETPRYSPPPGDTTSNPPPAAETPHYTARPAPVDNAPRGKETIKETTKETTTTPSTASHTPSEDYSPRRDYSSRGAHGRMMRAEHSHHHRLTVGRVIAALHHYGIYW